MRKENSKQHNQLQDNTNTSKKGIKNPKNGSLGKTHYRVSTKKIRRILEVTDKRTDRRAEKMLITESSNKGKPGHIGHHTQMECQ